MSKPRKLAIAGVILVGGYFAALVLGGVPELVIEPAGSRSPQAVDGSWFAGRQSWLAEPQAAASEGELVPDSPSNLHAATDARLARHPNQPTWLSTTTETELSATTDTDAQAFMSNAPPLANYPTPSAAPETIPPRLIENPPLAAEPISATRSASAPPLRAAPPSVPKARITEVRPVAAIASQPAASNWDRWPRTPPDDQAAPSQNVPATFQDLSALPSLPPRSTIHESEIVRRNSPPRDPGAAPEGSLRTHIVIDGDTLTRLADRYLDDPQRSPEIYRLNRDILTNPELLPIGVELRIPARERPGDVLAALNSTGSVAASHPEIMVPVTWTPTPLREPPQAKLLQPVPTALEK